MKPAPPILVTDLFPKIDALLVDLLKSLSDEDWHKATVCRGWSVKDIAAHLLDTAIRRLSMQRDQYRSPESETSFKKLWQLVDYLNQLNADWVKASRRGDKMKIPRT